MNELLNIPKDAKGAIWANKNNKQLRYNIGTETEWILPMSIYDVGMAGGDNLAVKRGQPVAIGLYDELFDDKKTTANPCVVVANPAVHSSALGIAIEPGDAVPINKARGAVHVQSSGQIIYNLSTYDPQYDYVPPNKGGKFIWTYADVGKTVYVSGLEPGALTLDITEAYYNNGKLLSIGKLVDAPAGILNEQQVIAIEIQCGGDQRGITDSTEFSVLIAPAHKQKGSLADISTKYDRLVFIKLVYDVEDGTSYGHFVTGDDVLGHDSDNSPIGAVKLSPEDGKISVREYCGVSLTITRLGILSGNFDVNDADIGKDLYLSNGSISAANTSADYEYKVGTLITKDKVLIDCRFVKQLSSTGSRIGTVRPAYRDIVSGRLITEPGFVGINKGVVHKVVGPWDKDDEYPLIDFQYLIKNTMYKDVYEFSYDYKPASPNSAHWHRVNADGNTDTTETIIQDNVYFRFREVFYQIGDATVSAQIKYTSEGAPEDYEYLWPEMSYELLVVPQEGELWGGTVDSRSVEIDISDLVAQGSYQDAQDSNLESYYIEMREKETGMIMAPGFYHILNEDGSKTWYGYQWAIANEGTGIVKLVLVTNPSTNDNYIDDSECVGVTWPIGEKISKQTTFIVTVRRRPTEYHNLYLNQLSAENPWAPHTDGNNLVTENTLLFGKLAKSENASSWDSAGHTLTNDYVSALKIAHHDPKKDGTRYSTIDWLVSPQATGKNSVSPIDKLYYRINGFDSSIVDSAAKHKTIQWTYDFTNHTASLDASFGGNFKTQSLSQFEWANKALWSNNALNMLAPLSNLKLYGFNYPEADDGKISVQKADVEGTLSTTWSGVNATTKTITLDDVLKKDLFSNNNEYIDYQTALNVALVALGNASKRINFLEEYMFGEDYAELYSYNSNSIYPPMNEIIKSKSLKGGVARAVSKMLQNYVVIDNISQGSVNVTASDAYTSYYAHILTAIYSTYSDTTTYDSNLNNVLINGTSSLDFTKNNFVDIIATFTKLNIQDIIPYKTINTDILAGNFEGAWIDITKVAMATNSFKFLDSDATNFCWNVITTWGITSTSPTGETISSHTLTGLLLDVYNKFGYLYDIIKSPLKGINTAWVYGHYDCKIANDGYTDYVAVTPKSLVDKGLISAMWFDDNNQLSGYGSLYASTSNNSINIGAKSQRIYSNPIAETNSKYIATSYIDSSIKIKLDDFSNKVFSELYASHVLTDITGETRIVDYIDDNGNEVLSDRTKYPELYIISHYNKPTTAPYNPNIYSDADSIDLRDKDSDDYYFVTIIEELRHTCLAEIKHSLYYCTYEYSKDGVNWTSITIHSKELLNITRHIGHTKAVGYKIRWVGHTSNTYLPDGFSLFAAHAPSIRTNYEVLYALACNVYCYNKDNSSNLHDVPVGLEYTLNVNSNSEPAKASSNRLFADGLGTDSFSAPAYDVDHYAPRTVTFSTGAACDGVITLTSEDCSVERECAPIQIKAVEHAVANDADKIYHTTDLMTDADDGFTKFKSDSKNVRRTIREDNDDTETFLKLDSASVTDNNVRKTNRRAIYKLMEVEWPVSTAATYYKSEDNKYMRGTYGPKLIFVNQYEQSYILDYSDKVYFDISDFVTTVADGSTIIDIIHKGLHDYQCNLSTKSAVLLSSEELCIEITDNLTPYFNDTPVEYSEIERLKPTAKETKAYNNAVADIPKRENTIEQLNTTIEARQNDLGRCRTALAAKNTEIDNTNAEINRLFTVISDSQNSSEVKMQAIQDRQKLITDTLPRLQNEKAAIETRIQEDENALTKLNEDLANNKAAIEADQKTITAYNQKNETYLSYLGSTRSRETAYTWLEGTLTVSLNDVSWTPSPRFYDDDLEYSINLTKVVETSHTIIDLDKLEVTSSGTLDTRNRRSLKDGAQSTQYKFNLDESKHTINLPYSVNESTLTMDPQNLVIEASDNKIKMTYDLYENLITSSAETNLVSSHVPYVEHTHVVTRDDIENSLELNVSYKTDEVKFGKFEALTSSDIVNAFERWSMYLIDAPQSLLIRPTLFFIKKRDEYKDWSIYLELSNGNWVLHPNSSVIYALGVDSKLTGNVALCKGTPDPEYLKVGTYSNLMSGSNNYVHEELLPIRYQEYAEILN